MAFARWRNILVNWISCFDGGTDWQLQPHDALDRIVSQLRGSSLDRSQTIDDFILDKYPEFKFENGTSRPSTDDDVCMAASLLLLYVCVRSKDVNMKSVMCSKLSREDQEVILKFTKCLMNRTPVTYGDVRAAVLECTSAEFPSVAECASGSAGAGTPPPLRALHGEVRRLRAALDAERFDRAYLQDELLATTGKLEKLMKDKEQHQKEILSLKAQLAERQSDLDTTDPATPERGSARRLFARQMSALEERLVDTQGLLEECERARDVYKSKIDEMKLDRDKWVEFGQVESGRACDLAEQLDAEKKTSSSLQEMLNELHAHNKLNQRDDSSFLECDDTDSPRSRSFVHDSSVCGDACAGVVEVQLCEERARVASLSQDLLSLQDKVKKLEDTLMVKEEEILSKTEQIEKAIKVRGEMEATFEKQRTDIQMKLDENLQVIQNSTTKLEELSCEKELLEKKVSEFEKIIIANESNIEELQIENAQLNAKYEVAMREFNAEKNSLEKILTEFKNNVITYKDELNLLRSEHAKSEENAIAFTVKIEKLNYEKELLEKKVSESEKIIISNESNIEELKIENAQLNAKYEEAMRDFNAEKNSLENMITEIKNTVATYKDELNLLRSEHAKSEENAIAFTVKIEELNCEKELLDKKVSECEKIIISNESIIEELQIENARLNAKYEVAMREFNAEKNSLEKILTEFKNNVITYKDELNLLRSEHAKSEENAIVFTVKIEKLNYEKELLEKKVSESEKIIISNESNIEELKIENAQLNAKYEEAMRDFNAEKNSLENMITEIKNTVATYKDELNLLRSEHANSEENAIAFTVKIEELNCEKELLDKKVSECEKIIISNDSNIEELKIENAQLNAKYEEAMRDFNAEKNSLENMITEIKNTVATYKDELNLLRSEHAKSEENAIAFTVKIEELNCEKELLDKKVSECEKIIISNDSNIEELKIENAQLNAKYEEAMRDFNAEKNSLENMITEIKNTVATYKDELNLLRSEHAKSEENAIAFTVKIEELNCEKELLDKKVSECEKIIISNDSNIEELKIENAQLNAKYEEAMRDFNAEKNSLENMITEIKNTVTTYEAQLDLLRSELAKSEENAIVLTVKIEGLQLENDCLQKRQVELDNTVTSQLVQIEQLQKDYVKLKSHSDETVKLMGVQINQFKTEKSEIEKSLMNCEKIIIDNELQLTRSQDAVVRMEQTIQLNNVNIENLVEENKTLQAKQAELTDIITFNEYQITLLRNENTENKRKTENTIEELYVKIQNLKEAREDLEKKIIAFENAISQLQNENILLKDEAVKTSQHLHDINDTLKNEKECLQMKVCEYENVLGSNKLKMVKLQEENVQNKLIADDTLKKMSHKIEELQKDNCRIEEKIIDCTNIIATNETHISQLENEIVQIKTGNDDTVNRVKVELEKLKTENISLEKKLIEYENMIISDQAQIAELQNENENTLKEKLVILEELTAAKKAFETNELELQLVITTEKFNQLKMDQLEEDNIKLKSDSEDFSKSTALEIAELKMNKQVLEKQMMECENTNKSLQLEMRNFVNENSQLKSKVEDMAKLCNEANMLNNALKLEHKESSKELNDLIEKVNLRNIEMENKISEQCNEISKLVEENKEIESNSERTKELLESICQSIDNVLLSEDPNSADIPFIDINEEKIEKTLNVHVKNLKNFIQNSIYEKSVLEKCISELKTNIRATNEEVYSIKLKLKIIISQNIGYLDTMIKDTDLFENKYGFVNVTQESCNIPDANNSFEQFVTALESILSRHKMIANVFKTEYKSLSETHKQDIMEKENVSESITTVKNDYEKRLQNLNDQLLDKKALVSHLEKDIADMQNDKNAIINNLSDLLEKAKIENAKVSEESKVQMEELQWKLEEGNKARENIILKKDEEYNIKANATRKEFVEQIESLQTELRDKNKELDHKLNIEKYITNLRTNITDMIKLEFPDSEEKSTVILPNNCENCVAVNLLRHPSVQSTTSGIVKSLCDEEKIKSISSDEPELANLQSCIQLLLQQTTLAMKALNEASTNLKDEVNKNSKLQSELLAKSSLVHSLEQDIANVELKFDDVNTEFKKIKEQYLIMTELLETKESHLKVSDAKLMALETVIAEKEELVKDLNNNLVTVSTERNSLKENLHAKDDAVRQIMQQLNVIMDSCESNDSATFEDAVQNIETLLKSFPNESDLKLLPLLKSIFSTITELKERNKTLNIKCQEMELEMNSKIKVLANEVAALSESIAHREDLVNDVRVTKEKDVAELQMQVHMLSTDLIGTSEERNQTISNLEKIVYDKNRIITTLQGDITYLKSLVAESEYKLLDVTKELEQCRENCQQLSAQLKRSVNLKNEEISNLKKQLFKMNSHESNASQIIKVSAKYQAIILKRIAEIKSNTVLRELSQFTNVDGDKLKSSASGTVTVDELENFLEGTEKHLRKLAERQSTLQKERDTLAEVSKINESETISLKKYLTELLAHFKTFTSVKEVYNQKLSQVISKQRMIRREIHSLDQNIPEGVMYKLERSYGIVMQDLCETALNFGRWAERCIDRSISPEKLKQAFASDAPSLSTSHFHNTGLEVQIEELMMAFKKVYEEVQKAKSTERSKPEACSVMEVRAEYEDKLNRMKAKMKQLYHEQMSACQSKQEAELDRLRRRLEDKSKAYEEHIQGLTRELWSVGEKLLVKKEEAEWLRRRQPTSSLMSLQHVHSSGLGPPPREGRESRREDRPADTQSLHGVPAHKPKSEGRGFHMSDEEGEVFDNRWLKELETPPRPERDGRRTTGAGAAGRISELKYRNSLCPPHLKSSYPAETHYAAGAGACNEDEIKFEGAPGGAERRGRKEVGITAYKKPGPPTPSKNAGRLSATDSELRESLRAAAETPTVRKTTTPSRLRALFRSNRSDAENTGTPRSRRLSIFRKKQ